MGFKPSTFLFVLFLTSLTSFAALHLSTRDLHVKDTPPAEYVVGRYEESDEYNYSQADKVLILMWDGGTPFGWGDGEVIQMPNYGGFTYHKGKCPVQCEWSTDRALLPSADALLFDPCLTGPDGYRDIPVYMPDKLPKQQWGWFTYEQYYYFPMMKEPDYMDRFDYKMTYHHDAEVQITFACPWAGVDDLLSPPPPKSKEKIVAFFASNCDTGGAEKRTEYVRELMKHIHVDSFGYCLKNANYQSKGRGHQQKMHDKITVISEYKFLLAFENNNVEDYVTEKVINAYQAGTVPVYMGSPTIDKWQVAPHSLIKASDYPDPKELAKILNYLNDNDDEYMKYFAWKQTGISTTFQRLWNNCFAFAECRLCKYIAKSRETQGKYEKPEGLPARGAIGYALQLNGLDSDLYSGDDFVEVPYHPKLDVSEEYTLMAWIKLSLIMDGRIIDKNTAGDVNGYNFDVARIKGEQGKGRLRLCAGDKCFQSTRSLGVGLWYHVSASVTTKGGAHKITLYVNGKRDSEHISGKVTATNKLKLRFGKAAEGGGSWRPHHASSIFDGVLDEISIWSRALSGDEIFEYMFARPEGNEEDLVGWWNFNEGSGGRVNDVGPNGIHGQIVGQPVWVVSVSKPVLDPSNAEGLHDNDVKR